MNKINWDEVQEASEFDNPKPGAYIATICRVEDVEEKEYLLIEWDFAEGAYKDNNRDTFARAGFWPIQLRRSYKPSAWAFSSLSRLLWRIPTPATALMSSICGTWLAAVSAWCWVRRNTPKTPAK